MPETVLLALDPQHFDTTQNARQVLVPGAKHPDNPILRPRAGAWDGTRCKVYGTVLVDPKDGLFRMWYSGSTDYPDAVRRRDGARRHVGYACSQDGIHWERPALGLVEYDGSKENNLVQLDAQAPSVFLQEQASADRRFLMITETGLDTHHNKVLYSADGIHWTEPGQEPIPSDTGQGRHEPFSILHDPQESDPTRRWKGYSLIHVRRDGYRGRAVGLFLAPEPYGWQEYPIQPIMSATEGMESEIHIPHVTRFHGTYVMLYDAMEPNHHTQTEIAVSDDGITFRRVQNGVKVIPNGKPGEPDAGKVCVSPRSLFTHDGKIWWYYTISADTYQTGPRGLMANPWYRYTALAQWRQDGFAYLGAISSGDQATVTSRLLEVGSGGLEELWLNAEAPVAGSGITIDLLDEAGQSLATSQPWLGDHLRGAITWEGGIRPPLTAGQKVSLRLHFSGADTRIYAMGIGNVKPAAPVAHTASRPPGSLPVPRRTATSPGLPKIRWSFTAQAKISGSPVLDGDTVYFGSWDQSIYAIDTRQGAQRWKFETKNSITAAPAVYRQNVYVGSRDGYVYALDANNGHLQWKTQVYNVPLSTLRNPNGPWVEGSPTVGAWANTWGDEQDAPHRLFIGAHDRNMHAFDLVQGLEEWRFPTFNWILSRPAVEYYAVYFGSMDGYIYALDGRSGAMVWRYRAGRHLQYAPSVVPGSIACEAVCGSPLVDHGTVYCGADDGFMYALDSATGAERWVFQTQKWIWGRPLLSRGVLIVPSADGRIYGLDPASGRPVWRKATENGNYAEVVRWQDRQGRERALVACTSGRLYAVEPESGHTVWSFDAGAGLRAAPVVGTDGIIYLPTCTGSLHALEV
ncbi:MAG: PQQ-binding-like beta-propeller repeat protein [Chloroflexi bacterium]|nr:PQQ-binding-like beta-propeller repeat protein [Chloroflexota bacterium]